MSRHHKIGVGGASYLEEIPEDIPTLEDTDTARFKTNNRSMKKQTSRTQKQHQQQQQSAAVPATTSSDGESWLDRKLREALGVGTSARTATQSSSNSKTTSNGRKGGR